MKNQRKKQSQFMQALGFLLIYIHSCGYETSPGDTYPGKFKHKKGSYHDLGLAFDINLFKDGVYLSDCESHRPFGEYWEKLGGTWGGRFESKDGNHYSWGEGKGEDK